MKRNSLKGVPVTLIAIAVVIGAVLSVGRNEETPESKELAAPKSSPTAVPESSSQPPQPTLQSRGPENQRSASTPSQTVAVTATKPVSEQAETADVVAYTKDVLDGDTIKVVDETGREFTVRLQGIDAPESKQPFGLEATRALRQKLIGKTCQIKVQGLDRYQRTLGVVYVGETNVNLALLGEGLAWHYKKYDHDQSFADAERNAKSAQIGIWQHASRIAPWDWRNGVREETVEPVNAPSIRTTDITVYITDTGKKYHKAGCRYLDQSKSPIPLSRAASKYDACRVCKPPKGNIAAARNPKENPTRVVEESSSSRNSEAKLTHWLTIKSGVRHNSGCRWYENSKGRKCTATDGRACKICKG